jgi:hypothetical protein
MMQRNVFFAGRAATVVMLRRDHVDATCPLHLLSGPTIPSFDKCTSVQYSMRPMAIKVQKKLCSIAPSDKTLPSVVLDRSQRHLLANTAMGGNRCPIGVLDGWER